MDLILHQILKGVVGIRRKSCPLGSNHRFHLTKCKIFIFSKWEIFRMDLTLLFIIALMRNTRPSEWNIFSWPNHIFSEKKITTFGWKQTNILEFAASLNWQVKYLHLCFYVKIEWRNRSWCVAVGFIESNKYIMNESLSWFPSLSIRPINRRLNHWIFRNFIALEK